MSADSGSRVADRLSALAEKFGARDVVNASSQIAVVAVLAQRDDVFEGVLAKFLSDNGYIKELLESARERLEEVVAGYERMVIVDDDVWSALPAKDISELLRLFQEDQHADRESIRTLVLLSDIADVVEGRWAGKTSGSIGKPPELISLMAALLGDTPKLCLSFEDSALAGLQVAEPGQRIKLRMANSGLADLLMRFYFALGCDASCELVDPFKPFKLSADEAALLLPPFGQRVGAEIEKRLSADLRGPGGLTSEEAAVAALANPEEGRIVALVSTGTLSRGGASRRFRKWLVECAGLTAVVELPPRLLPNTSIGTALIVLDPATVPEDKSIHRVLLLSADTPQYVSETRPGRYRLTGWRDLAHAVLGAPLVPPGAMILKEALAENDYSLQSMHYQAASESGLTELLEGHVTLPLGSVFDIRIPLPVKVTKVPEGSEYVEVRISDFSEDGLIRGGSKTVLLGKEALNRIDRQVLKPGDVLIATKGTIGKAAIVSKDAPDNLLASQTTVIVRPKYAEGSREPPMAPIVLLRYLALPEVTSYLESFARGATIRFLRKKDLEDLPVPFMTEADQRKVLTIHEEILEELEGVEIHRRQAEALRDTAFQDVLSAQ